MNPSHRSCPAFPDWSYATSSTGTWFTEDVAKDRAWRDRTSHDASVSLYMWSKVRVRKKTKWTSIDKVRIVRSRWSVIVWIVGQCSAFFHCSIVDVSLEFEWVLSFIVVLYWTTPLPSLASLFAVLCRLWRQGRSKENMRSWVFFLAASFFCFLWIPSQDGF